ncbi:MAG: hypothetical protein NUV45_10145 [Tepidanaerobacteraceae bacterium]|nr:hypothetical protein [Tepidanaerobacteraceae bacterium]
MTSFREEHHLHADTTSVSVYGEYDKAEEGFIDIANGSSNATSKIEPLKPFMLLDSEAL